MRHIALIGIQLHGNDAGMLRGLFRFARQRPEWVIHDVIRPAVLATGETGNPCGAVANVIDPGVADRCVALGVPVVNVAGPVPGCEAFPSVGVDNAAVGRMAADHLWDCGFRQFAWFSHMPAYPYIGARGHAFEARVRERRAHCAEPFDREITLRAHAPESAGAARSEPRQPPDLVAWLRSLPRPCGVYATTDHGGRELCWLCDRLGIHVPEEMAIVGTDDFEFICETSRPPLSSVRQPVEEIGYRAAATLDDLLEGRSVPARVDLAPLDVRLRQSSDVMAIADPAVAAALAFIRKTIPVRLDVAQVARATGMNRRALERRFRTVLDHSVLEQIHAAMVTRARQLLVDTDLPIGEVAARAGFRDAQHVDLIFRKTVGISPIAVRRQTRAR